MAKRKYDDNHVAKVRYKYLLHLLWREPKDGCHIMAKTLVDDGRKRKGVMKDLIEDGYLLPPDEGKEYYHVTDKAYHECKAKEPHLLGAWWNSMSIDPGNICAIEVYDNNRCSDRMKKSRAGVCITPWDPTYPRTRKTGPASDVGVVSMHEEIKWILETEDTLTFTMLEPWKDPVVADKPAKGYNIEVYVANQALLDHIEDLYKQGSDDMLYAINLKWGLSDVLGLTDDEVKKFLSQTHEGGLVGRGIERPRKQKEEVDQFYQLAVARRDAIKEQMVSLACQLELMTKALTMVDCKYESPEVFLATYRTRLLVQMEKQREEKEKADEEALQKLAAEADTDQ